MTRFNRSEQDTSITMATVARHAGVSKSTVSYVLSGRKRISAEVTERVWQAVNELGYRPSSAARSLASRKSLTIGLFCNPTETLREDPYFNQLLSGVLDAIGGYGYQLTLFPEASGDEAEAEHDGALPPAGSIDGALVMNPRVDSSGLERLADTGVPLVVIGTTRSRREFFSVDHDQAAVIYQALEYLARKRHRRILFINSPETYVGTIQREEGFELARTELRLEKDPQLIRRGKITLEDGERICSEALDAGLPFSAVLTMSDIMAVGAIRALRAFGRRVPQDVAVVSSGNTIIAGVHSPALTATMLYPYEQGREAGAILIDVIQRRRLRPTHTTLPVTFVTRESA